MDQIELQRCKDDIVYFAEKYCGVELTAWQKAVLKLYQSNPGKMILAGQRNGKRMLYQIKEQYKNLDK